MKKIFFLFILLSSIAFAQKASITTTDIDRRIDDAFNIVNTENPNKAIPVLQKINIDSKSINYNLGILKTGYALNIIYYNKADYNKVITLSDEAITAGKKIKNYGYLSHIHRNKGNAYLELGFIDNSGKELFQALDYAKKLEDGNEKYYTIALLYDNLAGYYEKMKAPQDSIFAYMTKALKEVKKINDNDANKTIVVAKYNLIAFEYMCFGVEYSKLNKPEIAEEYFKKSLDVYETKKSLSLIEEVILLSEMGRFYYSQKRYDEAVKYAEQGLLTHKNPSSPKIRRDLFETLSKSYLELNKIEDSKKYLNKFTYLNDSISKMEKEAINISSNSIATKQDENHLADIKKITVIYILIAAVLVLLVAKSIINYWKKRYAKLKKKYDTLITNLALKAKESTIEQPVVTEENAKQKTLTITDETVNSLLEKLAKFEKSQKYTKQDMSLSTLASQLNTNTKYLSEIIKQHKGKKFSDYINGLRITYITEQLYNNPVYRDYKNSYLAECCGFSSREVFTVVFKKETGVSPSYFIENLKE